MKNIDIVTFLPIFFVTSVTFDCIPHEYPAIKGTELMDYISYYNLIDKESCCGVYLEVLWYVITLWTGRVRKLSQQWVLLKQKYSEMLLYFF